MCGIAGFVHRIDRRAAIDRDADLRVLARMTRALARRGPDGEGLWLEPPEHQHDSESQTPRPGLAALGHRRLAIIDPAGGAQPLQNEDGRVWITYNGELYDEIPHRRRLESLGHRYRTGADTETLVHLYEERGTAFPALLNGMYAFALWDRDRRTLLLARDPRGQKPLYYALTPRGDLVFASEPKALLEHPEIPRDLDPRALPRYLFYEYLPAPHSAWRGVRKLPPGHHLVWRADDPPGPLPEPIRHGPPERPRPDPALTTNLEIDLDRAAETFWNAFVPAVERHLRSDVPVGVFLSGGVDSSAVAAAAVRVLPPASVRTFSIGFDDPSFDESRHARAVAEHLGVDHRERRFTPRDALALLDEVPEWLDEPFGDASILPTHLLARFAREHVVVALGGDGADELLAGYPTFRAEPFAARFARLPPAVRRILRNLAARLPVRRSNFSLDFRVKQFLRGADCPPALAHQRWLGSFSGPEIARLLVEPPDFDVEREHLERARILAEVPPDTPSSRETDPLAAALALYQGAYLPEDILFKVDRASMARGLEVRAPFLDLEILRLLQALPSRHKRRPGGFGGGKLLLKRAMSRDSRLPPAIVARGKKGFGIPVADWLRGPLGPLLDELLGPRALAVDGVFRPDAVARLVREHRDGIADHRKPLWTLLAFQLWKRRWLDRRT